MDVALLQSYANSGMMIKDIAAKMNMSYAGVRKACIKHGIEPGREPLCDNTKRIIELRQQGVSMKAIAKQLGISVSAVHGASKRNNVDGAIIEQRLTESQVADYVSRSGFTYVGGYINGKSPVTVKCIECGKMFDRQFHIFRDVVNGTFGANTECPFCKEKKIRENKEQKERQKEQERQARKEQFERDAQERAMRKAEQLSRKANEQLVKRLAIHVCKNCGNDFCMELSGYNSSSYCSEKCQKRYHDRLKRDKRMVRILSREHDKDITLEGLFRRDDGVCYICGKKCDWSDIDERDGAKIAGESYPSIDHVKPIAKGGTHTWDNIKLACRSCNRLKGWN